MKYLFIIQGEGRGHLTQAMTMEKLLHSRGHEVVEMLVGKSESRTLPAFFTEGVNAPITYFESVNFVSAAQGKRPDALKTVLFNLAMSPKFIPSISLIRNRIKDSGADVVVNFYEILGTIAHGLTGRKVPMVCIGHQFLFLHKDFKFPSSGYSGHYALNFFTNMVAWGAAKVLALSFRPMRDDPKRKIKVVPPLLRPEVLRLRRADGTDDPAVRDGGYIHGYMLNAGFSQDVLEWHSAHPDVPLRFFWDRADEAPVKVVDETLSFYYLNDEEFLRQMAGCHAYASTAGFESVCEAMYLGKPLLMVPSHVEQKCNAYDATEGYRMDCGAVDGVKENGSVPRPAVTSDSFDLDLLLHFADNEFVADKSFPQWARLADSVFLKELTFL